MRRPVLRERSWIGAARVALGALAAAASQASEPDICNVAPREAPLDFTLPSVDGREIALGDYAGRVILLDFWATWCAPCREEIPGLVELYERYGDAGFVVLGVAVDDEDDAVGAYVEELGITYPVLLENGRYELRDAYGPLVGFPTSFLITREGTICVRHVGIASKERHEAEIEALL